MDSQKQYNTPKAALVLCAGFGKRLMPITKDIPKCMVEVDGEKVVDRVINSLVEFGVQKIIVNTFHHAEKLENYLCEKYNDQNDFELLISHENQLLETGGGVLNAMKSFNEEELIVLNGDVVFFPGHLSVLKQIAEKWNDKGSDLIVGLYPKDDVGRENGDFNLVNDKLSYEGNDKKYIFTGCYIMNNKIFGDAKVECFSMTDILFNVDKLPYRFKGVALDKVKWFDIGTPETLEETNNFFRNEKRLYKQAN